MLGSPLLQPESPGHMRVCVCAQGRARGAHLVVALSHYLSAQNHSIPAVGKKEETGSTYQG